PRDRDRSERASTRPGASGGRRRRGIPRPFHLVRSRGRFRTVPPAGIPSSSPAPPGTRRRGGRSLDRWVHEKVVAKQGGAAEAGGDDQRIRTDTVERVAGDRGTRRGFNEQCAGRPLRSGISREGIVRHPGRRAGTNGEGGAWIVVKITTDERSAAAAHIFNSGIPRAADFHIAQRDARIA